MTRTWYRHAAKGKVIQLSPMDHGCLARSWVIRPESQSWGLCFFFGLEISGNIYIVTRPYNMGPSDSISHHDMWPYKQRLGDKTGYTSWGQWLNNQQYYDILAKPGAGWSITDQHVAWSYSQGSGDSISDRMCHGHAASDLGPVSI